jgi:hypothetical protein
MSGNARMTYLRETCGKDVSWNLVSWSVYIHTAYMDHSPVEVEHHQLVDLRCHEDAGARCVWLVADGRSAERKWLIG